MLIHVQYTDNHFDYVNQLMLDDLLDAEKVSGFRRSTGWVRVGIDQVRKTRRSHTFKMSTSGYTSVVH